jgi:diketogulonate reductase-like aldo/keto reductase
MTGRSVDQARRKALKRLARFGAGIGAGLALAPVGSAKTIGPAILMRPIPSTGERLPVIGMGSWLTFDVGRDPAARNARSAVLQTFLERGGGLIDSSPMYGSSEAVIGYCLAQMANRAPDLLAGMFAATKVWTPGQSAGIDQMNRSQALWGVPRFDVMQIHNLVDWQAHLETLLEWKADGRVRYIGITTSHGRRHGLLASIMAEQPIDFVQLTYNVLDREAERRLLPLAAERGLAVIVNRPFRRGGLFDTVAGKALPPWAAEFDARNWAQVFLKFIVSHPAVTCAIPATSKVDHMLENMEAGYGRLPSPALRERTARYVLET